VCLRKSSQSLVHSHATRATSRLSSTDSGLITAPQLGQGKARWSLAQAKPAALASPHSGQCIRIATAYICAMILLSFTASMARAHLATATGVLGCGGACTPRASRKVTRPRTRVRDADEAPTSLECVDSASRSRAPRVQLTKR